MSKNVALLLFLLFTIASCIFVAKPALSAADIAENSWVSKQPMQVARSGLGVAMVNGKIYAIGGSAMAGSYPYSGGIVGTNEEYDPSTNTWRFKNPMPTPRTKFGIAVYNNKIYCIGGKSSSGYTGVNEVYDPATDTWETKEPMPTPRFNLDANVVDGKIYLIGGYDPNLPYGGDATAINEVYDSETDTWTTKTPMFAAKSECASAVFGDKIYLIGGGSLWSQERNLNQIYDTKTDSWSYGAPFPYEFLYGERAGVTTGVNAPERIYVFGEMHDFGEESEYSIRIYNPGSDRWTIGADIPTGRGGFGVAVFDDMLYVIGGETAVTASGIPFSGDPPTITKYSTNERYVPFGYGTVSPVVCLVSPENQIYNETVVSLVFTVNKPVSWLGYSLDGQENVTVTGNTTIPGLTNGLHNVTVYARDEFGNVGASETVCFSVAEEPFPVAPVAVASAATVAITGVGLLVYFKKRKRYPNTL